MNKSLKLVEGCWGEKGEFFGRTLCIEGLVLSNGARTLYLLNHDSLICVDLNFHI